MCIETSLLEEIPQSRFDGLTALRAPAFWAPTWCFLHETGAERGEPGSGGLHFEVSPVNAGNGKVTPVVSAEGKQTSRRGWLHLWVEGLRSKAGLLGCVSALPSCLNRPRLDSEQLTLLSESPPPPPGWREQGTCRKPSGPLLLRGPAIHRGKPQTWN